jgi:hypothetical protein
MQLKRTIIYLFIFMVAVVYNNESLKLFSCSISEISFLHCDDQNTPEENQEGESKDVKLKYADDFLVHQNILVNRILEINGSAYMDSHKDCTTDYNREVFYPPEFT